MAISARDSLKDLLQELEAFVTTKTVVGEPIHIDNTIILPLVDVSFGAGAGAKEKSAEKNNGLGAGGGVGAKMSACLLYTSVAQVYVQRSTADDFQLAGGCLLYTSRCV